MRLLWCAALALGLCASCATSPEPPNEAASSDPFLLDRGPYPVGFQLLDEQDPSRAVPGGGATAFPRPIRVYLWYPAERAEPPMRFGRYADLADEDVWPAEIAGALHDSLTFSRRPLARSLSPQELEALLEQPVLAAENARPMDGPFPLIVVGLGYWYESPTSIVPLAEYLAARGFVVATAPLMGTSSPIVTVDARDLDAFVADLEFVIARARERSFVSPDGLGILGFDMGGMAGLMLPMRNPDVDAFASLGSGILFEHPSGLPRSMPGYDPLALRVPWLNVAPDIATRPPPGSSEQSLFEIAAYSERYQIRTAGIIEHTDFTTEGLIEGRGSMPGAGYWPQETPQVSQLQRPVRDYVFNFFAATLAHDANALAFLSRDPGEAIPGATLDHRPAAPASITDAELVEAVVAGRGNEAVGRLRALAAAEPNNALLDESYLQRRSASLLLTWGLAEETIPLIELMIERFPATPGYRLMLAQAHISAGDTTAAIDVYSRFIEQYPDNPNAQIARAQLERLRGR